MFLQFIVFVFSALLFYGCTSSIHTVKPKDTPKQGHVLPQVVPAAKGPALVPKVGNPTSPIVNPPAKKEFKDPHADDIMCQDCNWYNKKLPPLAPKH